MWAAASLVPPTAASPFAAAVVNNNNSNNNNNPFNRHQNNAFTPFTGKELKQQQQQQQQQQQSQYMNEGVLPVAPGLVFPATSRTPAGRVDGPFNNNTQQGLAFIPCNMPGPGKAVQVQHNSLTPC